MVICCGTWAGCCCFDCINAIAKVSGNWLGMDIRKLDHALQRRTGIEYHLACRRIPPTRQEYMLEDNFCESWLILGDVSLTSCHTIRSILIRHQILEVKLWRNGNRLQRTMVKTWWLLWTIQWKAIPLHFRIAKNWEQDSHVTSQCRMQPRIILSA